MTSSILTRISGSAEDGGAPGGVLRDGARGKFVERGAVVGSDALADVDVVGGVASVALDLPHGVVEVGVVEGVEHAKSIAPASVQSDLFVSTDPFAWRASHGQDRAALDVVDGVGVCSGHGPHYSRRTPGSACFTGIGKELVLVTENGRAVWAVVEARAPTPRGTGRSRGRAGETVERAVLWRNIVFRNLGAGLSSALIRVATALTYALWRRRYGALPASPLRTEIDTRKTSSPSYCYKCAGWTVVDGPPSAKKRRPWMVYLVAPAEVTA